MKKEICKNCEITEEYLKDKIEKLWKKLQENLGIGEYVITINEFNFANAELRGFREGKKGEIDFLREAYTLEDDKDVYAFILKRLRKLEKQQSNSSKLNQKQLNNSS